MNRSLDPYLYPGTATLRNRLHITDPAVLNRAERDFVAQRAAEGIPAGGFDLAHFQAIHRHLFQDVYEWAGEIRAVELSRGAQQFQFVQYIGTGFGDVHRRLVRAHYFATLSRPHFAHQLSVILRDIDSIHPFRDGNGRTLLHYFKLLAEHAGHAVDLARLSTWRWIEVSEMNPNDERTLEALERLILHAVD